MCSLIAGTGDTFSVTMRHITCVSRTGLMLPAVTLYREKKTHLVHRKDRELCLGKSSDD